MSDKSALSRRQMLVGTGLAGAAVAGSAGSAQAEAPATVSDDDPRRPVLHDTPHIRAFYNLARD